MKVIPYPTKDAVKYFSDGTIYLKSDQDTIDQYCEENSYEYVSHEKEEQRFSNDGALAYAFYAYNSDTETADPEWQVQFGFDKIVMTLKVTESE